MIFDIKLFKIKVATEIKKDRCESAKKSVQKNISNSIIFKISDDYIEVTLL